MTGIELSFLDWIQTTLRCGVLDEVMLFFTTIGDAGAVWIIASLICLSRPQWRRAGVAMLVALVLSFAVSSLIIKPLVARPRPCDVVDAVQLLLPRPSGSSFPSAHAATAFACACALLFERRSAWPAAMALAFTIALSRMYLFVHYPSDVLAGAMVGFLSGLAACVVVEHLYASPRVSSWLVSMRHARGLSNAKVASLLWTMLCGFSMALADSVPGVSGGTLAFIMGFYDKLIGSLHDLARGSGRQRKAALVYLVKLGAGWVVGMGIALAVLSKVLDANVYALSSAFLGLTAAAIPLIAYRERDALRAKPQMAFLVLVGFVVVAGISLLRLQGGSSALDFTSLNALWLVYLIVAGFVAISAMVLPGISGSTLLLIFGVYAPAVLAVKEFAAGQLVVVFGLAALALGAVLGVCVAIGVLKRALERFRPAMVYLIEGLMIGSLIAIVLGPTALSTAQAPLALGTFSFSSFLLGVAILGGLEALRIVCQKRMVQPAPCV